MNSSSPWPSQIVPARLAFLAIYNPSLGPTDETFAEQLVFYYSRVAQETRAAAKKHARNDAAGGDALQQEENEKLRQIGLAQGMVDFARGFSEGEPVDSIDTEKSRFVLHELEAGWWILASIDLTRLPTLTQSKADSGKKSAEKAETLTKVEYSSREVSPSDLLLQQLIQAHHVFGLHHGPSLTELFVRFPREKFCGILERYWTRYARTWDVLLHGNPATDIFDGIKLSSGGELGIGVGEEEWGSSERAVLEDLTLRTEGLVDLLVSRFGDIAPSKQDAALSEIEGLPWLGSGNHPLAADGIIFGGSKAITKSAVRNLSLWMRQIYTFGDHAYGVRDNPHRERRRRRRRNPLQAQQRLAPDSQDTIKGGQNNRLLPKASDTTSARDWSPHENSLASKALPDVEDPATDTQYLSNIPPPIIRAASEALDKATENVDSDTGAADTGTTMGIPDNYMKYLTFGLSTLAKSSPPPKPETSRRASKSTQNASKPTQSGNPSRPAGKQQADESDEEGEKNTNVEPLSTREAIQQKIETQKRRETKGQFVIGLEGDLDEAPEDAEVSNTDSSLHDDSDGPRIALRTLQVEIVPQEVNAEEEQALREKKEDPELMPATEATRHFRRLRVLVYVHRPFMYCFLFEDRCPSLALPGFYRRLHRNLQPIHRQLLSSTSQARITQRIEDSQASATVSDAASTKSSGKASNKSKEPAPIYDLIYDPATMTVHTSIPNIPEPGTSAAEGIITGKKDTGMPSWPGWTRIEALNVHNQILNTLSSTKGHRHEYERTCKTTRGWWVVWMKLPPSVPPPRIEPAPLTEEPEQVRPSPESEATVTPSNANKLPASLPQEESGETTATSISTKIPFPPPELKRPKPPDMHRVAFLVRKASDPPASAAKANNGSRAVSSVWNTLTLRASSASDESSSGSSAGWNPATLAGGIGVDARKYIDGLLSLNR